MIQVSRKLMAQIHHQGEQAYPDEGAGFLLGLDGEPRRVLAIRILSNTREETSRHNCYLITPEDYMKGELEADRLGLVMVGIFHSHPHHPSQPSEYDRDWAQPFFSYVITSVNSGQAVKSRAWRLAEDRSRFIEELIKLAP